MSDLDKKLEVLVNLAYARGVNDGDGARRAEKTAKETATKIKQAFVDAGYLTPQERIKWHDDHLKQGHITKEEWEAKAIKDGWVKLEDFMGYGVRGGDLIYKQTIGAEVVRRYVEQRGEEAAGIK